MKTLVDRISELMNNIESEVRVIEVFPIQKPMGESTRESESGSDNKGSGSEDLRL